MTGTGTGTDAMTPGRPVDGAPAGMTGALRTMTGVTLVAALIGLLPGGVGRAGGLAAIAAVVSAPLLRLCWLVLHWARRRDLRFAGVALGLLAVVGAGAAIAALTS